MTPLMRKLLMNGLFIGIIAILSACGQTPGYDEIEVVENDIAIAVPSPSPSPIPSPTPMPTLEPIPELPPVHESLAPIGQTFYAGDGNSSFILEDGSLWGWGENRRGELADGTTEAREEPIHIMDNVVSARVGWGTSMALRTDGNLWSWSNHGEPEQIMDDVVYANWILAHRADGSLWDWNFHWHWHEEPEHIADDVTAFSMGGLSIMTIRSDGSLWGQTRWGGRNWHGELGDGTMEEERLSPVHIMDDVAYVSAGGFHTAAITSDGSLWVWGSNETGQLGSTITWPPQPSPVWVMDDVIAVSAGSVGGSGAGFGGNTVVIRDDGSLWGWGAGLNSGLAPEHGLVSMDWYNPTPQKMLDNAVQIFRGPDMIMALSSNGELWNLKGDIALIAENVAAADIGFNHMLVLMTDGSLWRWERDVWRWPFNIVIDGDSPVHIMDGVLMP